MSWLDPLLAIKTQQAGTTAGTRQTINFASGATVVDDPANDRVNVTIAGTGITQLTGDVTAGPGSGSIAATVAKVNGVSVSGTPTSGQVIRATSGTASSWANVARGDITNTSGATGDIITGDATTLGRLAIGSTGQVLTVSGGAPVWSNPGWFTAYEIDFTAQTPATYTANGTYTIGGQSWVLSGYNAAVTTDLSAANGLRVQVPSGASASIAPIFNSPAINTLASPNVATRDDMLIWLRAETYTATSGIGLSYADILVEGYYRATASTTFFARHLWQNSSTGGGVSGEQYVQFVFNSGTFYPSSAYSTYTTSNMSHDVKVLRLRDNGRMDMWSGSWSAGWPSFASLQYRGFAQVSTASAGSANGTLWYPADVNLAIRAGTEPGLIGIAGVRLKALRIQAR